MSDPASLNEKLGQFDSYDKRLLISRTEWGSIDFSAAAADVDSVFEVASLLRDLPLQRLPANAISQITDAFEAVLTWLRKMDEFNLQQSNPAHARNEIVNNLAVQQQNLYLQTHNWIPFLAYLKGDIPAQLGRITSSAGQAEASKAEFDKFVSAQRGEIESIVQATREAAAEAGVGSFTEDFLEDAKSRERDADTWLSRSVIAALASLIVAVGFFFVQPPDNQYSMIQYATSKIVILAMLIGITAWCAGNYKANKHQGTVSRFKAHALKTFQAFVQATDNDAVKDSVLLETTRAIFTQGQSGYIKGDASSEGTPRILEVIKNATGIAGGK